MIVGSAEAHYNIFSSIKWLNALHGPGTRKPIGVGMISIEKETGSSSGVERDNPDHFRCSLLPAI